MGFNWAPLAGKDATMYGESEAFFGYVTPIRDGRGIWRVQRKESVEVVGEGTAADVLTGQREADRVLERLEGGARGAGDRWSVLRAGARPGDLTALDMADVAVWFLISVLIVASLAGLLYDQLHR